MMTYKQIKWLILIIPTITIGIWEYVRHQYLLPYITMELGNLLAPIIVFLVTMTLLLKLFKMIETMQEELNNERSAKLLLEERERIARELHDDVAQSLFLLSVKVDQLEATKGDSITHQENSNHVYHALRKTVHQTNEYVRQAIANLRHAPKPNKMPWIESVKNLVDDFRMNTGLPVHMNWNLEESKLTAKEKIEIYSFIRELLHNVRKHASASHVRVEAIESQNNWTCTIEDDGIGFDESSYRHEDRFGLRILEEKALEMGWIFEIERVKDKTRVSLSTGGIR